MDPSSNSSGDESESAAMAAFMGFSSFGSQNHPAKKRKFNPATDAFVEGQKLASLDKGGPKGQGSGGNTIPLGRPREFGKTVKQAVAREEAARLEMNNDDEIALSDEAEEDGPQYVDTSRPPPTMAGQDAGREEIAAITAEESNDEPEYLDTSQPAPAVSEEEAQKMQARIDEILAKIGSGDSDSISKPGESSRELQVESHISGLPLKPGSGESVLRSGPRHSISDKAPIASSSRPSHRGQRNELWYVEYYDPTFNENPWAKLEKEKGLQQKGSWLENRGHRIGR